MFGIWRRRRTVVTRHWYVLFDNFETPVGEFYEAVERDLGVRELAGLELSRVEYAEGGLLSARREYLRMRRERLVFDVCAAPFGTTWFFSCRFAEIPAEIRPWELAAVLLCLGGAAWFYAGVFGAALGLLLFAASLLSLLALARSAAALGAGDVDGALLQIPVVGAFYERFVRAETYYREDTRLAYVDIVERVVKARIEELGKAGSLLVEYRDATPPSHPGILAMIGGLLRIAR